MYIFLFFFLYAFLINFRNKTEKDEQKVIEDKVQKEKNEKKSRAKQQERKQWSALPCENLDFFMVCNLNLHLNNTIK